MTYGRIINKCILFTSFVAFFLCIENFSHNQAEDLSGFKSVRITGSEIYGSGVLIEIRSDDYALLLTSDHVLRGQLQSICVVSKHGFRYPAEIVKRGGDDLDLALLAIRLRSRQNAYFARMNKDQKKGLGVFATGFPANSSYKRSPGKLVDYLKKPLKGGYDVLYSSYVEKGMSGGGVFDAIGQLVAINSLHQQPLWDAQLRYSDGSSIPNEMQDFIGHYSAGISSKQLTRFLKKDLQIPYISKSAKCQQESRHAISSS